MLRHFISHDLRYFFVSWFDIIFLFSYNCRHEQFHISRVYIIFLDFYNCSHGQFCNLSIWDKFDIIFLYFYNCRHMFHPIRTLTLYLSLFNTIHLSQSMKITDDKKSHHTFFSFQMLSFMNTLLNANQRISFAYSWYKVL